jgi:mitochondrial import inner membrane translocase subunit TIM50
MLSRLSQPLLRGLRQSHPALRTTLPVTRTRTYAKVGKPPSQQQVWQQGTSARSSRPQQSSNNATPPGSEDIAARASLNPSSPVGASSQRRSDAQSAAQSTPEPSQPSTPESSPETPEADDQQPLPDLTKGIPSTLEAELRQAQSGQKSHKSSFNITEDPAEPLPGDEGEGPRERAPRQEYVSSSDRKKNSLFKYTYLFLGLGSLGYALYLGRNWESEELEQKHAEAAPNGWGPGLVYNRIKARMGSTVSYYKDPVTTKLLPDEEKDPAMRMPFTLVLSLDDLLIHQEWSRAHGWRIAKRPGVDYFLRYLTQYYELVLFTSQPSASADQVLRKLDPYMMIRWPLFREATVYEDGGYIKVSLLPETFRADANFAHRICPTSIAISKR